MSKEKRHLFTLVVGKKSYLCMYVCDRNTTQVWLPFVATLKTYFNHDADDEDTFWVDYATYTRVYPDDEMPFQTIIMINPLNMSHKKLVKVGLCPEGDLWVTPAFLKNLMEYFTQKRVYATDKKVLL